MKQLLIYGQMVKALRITAVMGNVYLFQLKCIKVNIRQEDEYLSSILSYFACQIAVYLRYHLLLYGS